MIDCNNKHRLVFFHKKISGSIYVKFEETFVLKINKIPDGCVSIERIIGNNDEEGETALKKKMKKE